MQKDLIYIDIKSKSQIDLTGNFVTKTDGFPTIERGQWQVLCIQYMSRDVDAYGVVTLTPVDVSGSSYLLVADNDFDDSDSLMFKSMQNATPFDQNNPESNRFNLEGDWIDGGIADMTKGQMSIRINANTEKFRTALGSRDILSSGLYINIKQYIPGLTQPSSVVWTRFVAKNTIRDWGDTSEEVPSNAQVASMLDAYMKGGISFQFSSDAVSWHDVQTEIDKYYRQRIYGTDAAWSVAIRLLKGDKGDTPDDVYTITEVDRLLESKADATSTYTKEEIDNLIGGAITILEEL